MDQADIQGLFYYLAGLFAVGLLAEFFRAFIWVSLAYLFFGRLFKSRWSL